MNNDIKRWKVTYDHKDGRSGTVKVETNIFDSTGFKYGNGKFGTIIINSLEKKAYDLRYNHGDLHILMIQAFFGDGLVKIEQI